MKRVYILLLALQLSSILADDYEQARKNFGIQLWSIDGNKNAAPQICLKRSKDTFESNKNYVALVTTKLGDAIGWNLYMWMGSKAIGDSVLTATKFAAELGEKFKKDLTYSLEHERLESPLFKATFPAAFQSNEEKDPPKLYLVKGKTNILAVRVLPKISSLNYEDCFVLDPGYLFDVFLLCGKYASDNEKKFAHRLANALLKKQHNDPWGQVQALDDFNSECSDSNNLIIKAIFEHCDTASSADMKPFGAVYGKDEEFEKKRMNEVQLIEMAPDYQYTGEQQITKRPLKMNLLDSELCYVLDTESAAGIQIFIGRTSTSHELFGAIIQALYMIALKAHTVEEEMARGRVRPAEMERMKIHFVQQKRVPRTPDFLLNFVDLTEEYLRDLERESSTTDQ